MMTHDEMIEVIKAHKEGKEIERYKFDFNGEKWDVYHNLSEILERIANGEKFRIKPEPKYRPYETVDEVPVGRVVITKTRGKLLIVRAIESNYSPIRLEITIGIANYTPESCLDKFNFEDGSPCGIKV